MAERPVIAPEDCPEPHWHETHRYCPICTWQEPPPDASEEAPIYRKVEDINSGATRLFFITCDEGWRHSIVCDSMYEWAADWLLGVLGRRPYASRRSRAGREASK